MQRAPQVLRRPSSKFYDQFNGYAPSRGLTIPPIRVVVEFTYCSDTLQLIYTYPYYISLIVRNSYPKKVTYVFYPLPRETAQKKSPTFSCLPESVRALSVDDILPPDSKNYLREAFNAAIKYLSMKGLPRKNTYSVFCDCSSKDFLLKKYGVINRVIKESTKRQLCITGHENGTLRVWSAGDAVMQLLFVIDSRKEFLGFSEEEKDLSDNNRGDSCDTDSSDDDFQMTGEWPPFKKVGEFDPFCDGAGLSIQRIAFDEKCGQIVVGCRGGQVLIYSLEETEKGLTPHPLTIEMCDHSKLGSSAQDTRALPIRQTAWKYHPGYQPQSLAGSNKSIIVQLKPALAVTAVAILSSRHLIAASNEYGFALVDVNKQTILLQNSLVNQSDVAHRANAPFAGHLCDTERAAWDKCEYDDYIMRIKEFERERRLLMRKQRKEASAA
ncbi:hypothetical protein Q1695_014951 [Nippostrongylus brasiliensis]|nr:hypothetical protein Q1695_014951 [Nippostrongylus brasiliensis]